MSKLFCLQFDIAWENKAANSANVARWIARTSPPPGSLVLLPEMFATGFSMNVSQVAETADRETEGFLQKLAKDFAIYLVAGLVTRSENGFGRNEAVVFSPEGSLISRYCKIHPFSYGGESKNYTAGNDVVSFSWNGLNTVPFICYDLRFPEIFREAVRRGAQLYLVIANWPAKRESHWLSLLKARAIENQAYVAGVNRCGADPKLSYSGRSIIVDPCGEVIADAGERETMISAEIDLARLLAWRAEFPVLADMKP